jgi:hypothetical protein
MICPHWPALPREVCHCAEMTLSPGLALGEVSGSVPKRLRKLYYRLSASLSRYLPSHFSCDRDLEKRPRWEGLRDGV